MNRTKKKQLEAKGWKVGTVDEFLQLTPADVAYIELKLTVAKLLHELRTAAGYTQHEAAQIAETSQPRYSTLESGSSSCTLDLQINALLSLNCPPAKISAAMKEWAKQSEL